MEENKCKNCGHIKANHMIDGKVAANGCKLPNCDCPKFLELEEGEQ